MATLEQISVVCHIIFSKTSTSPRGALSLHSVECVNIKRVCSGLEKSGVQSGLWFSTDNVL